ncbi:MAG: antiviral reverse transcriptase Drt3b [Pseudomonadota bacterium]
MKEKIRIKQKDANRVLLTETLPYETPIIFSNKLLYHFSKIVENRSVTLPSLVKNIFLQNGLKSTIPYDYYIRQGVHKERHLSIIHPAHQLSFTNFYTSYSDLILSLCRKSRFSLRYPVRVASYFYTHEYDENTDLNENNVEEDPEIEGYESKYASSYFYYSKFNQLYKFIDSTEFLNLERQFCNLKKFDIKRCFASIYTHTISWAVKGKIFAKEHQGKSFDSTFDELMMTANYQETNGIVVGPEVSRIFAEIILQQIDANILKAINDIGIEDSEYAIRRYLDDYFLFSRNKDIEAIIYHIAERQLQEYKLYINESKTVEMTVPFATDQTIAKSDVQKILDQTILSWLAEVRRAFTPKNESENTEIELVSPEQLAILKTPFRHTTQIIRDIKISLKRSSQSFNIISGYALSAIMKSCYRLEKRIRKFSETPLPLQNLQILLTTTIEVVFFLYSMDFRVRTTYLVSQFMLIINKFGKLNERLNESLQLQLKNSALIVLNSRPKGELSGIEVYNLLIALRVICPNDNFSEKDIQRYFDISNKIKSSSFTYFDFIAFFYVTRGKPEYFNIHFEVLQELKKVFKNGDNRISFKSELTLLLVDMLSCPFVNKTDKGEILSNFSKHAFGKTTSEQERNELINFFTTHLHFVNWSDNLDLEKLLVRKQLNPGY